MAFNQLFKASECAQCEASKVENKKAAKYIVLEAWMEQRDRTKKYALAKIIHSNKVDSFTLSAVAIAIENTKSPLTGGAEILAKIISSDKADERVLSSVNYAIQIINPPIPDAQKLLSLIKKRESKLNN